jgi:hypothetical protein
VSSEGRLAGPFVSAALICDRVIREVDGALSAIRIVDQVTLIRPPTGLPAEIQIAANLWLLIALKGAPAPGRRNVRITAQAPDGMRTDIGLADVDFASTSSIGPPGANLVVQAVLNFRQTGIHWFDVLLDGNFLTSIPLEVRLEEGQAPQPSG